MADNVINVNDVTPVVPAPTPVVPTPAPTPAPVPAPSITVTNVTNILTTIMNVINGVVALPGVSSLTGVAQVVAVFNSFVTQPWFTNVVVDALNLFHVSGTTSSSEFQTKLKAAFAKHSS